MKLSWMKIAISFFLAGVLTTPLWAAETAVPGTVNYVEGQVTIGEQTLDAHAVGTALRPDESLTTSAGKAEILLTPGVFLRVNDQSSVKLVAGGLTNTEVSVDQGQAMVEVTEIHPENNLRIMEDGVSTQLRKTGLYGFDAATNQVRVFSGQAAVFDGDREVTVKGDHQVDFNVQGKLKAEKFDKQQYQESDLYRWSSLRSSYLAEANVDAARVYLANGWYGPGWVGAGWYWDPWFGAYTFIPGNGIFYSPFGFGFFSPLVVFRSPLFFGRPFVHQFGPAFHPNAVFLKPGIGGGFRSAPAMSGHGMVSHSGFGGSVHGGGGGHAMGRR
jgi:FecR protein